METTTKKEYKIKYRQGYDLFVPKGSRVSSITAMGHDPEYHFWVGWQKQVEELTGHKNSILAHDLTYYGLDIPKEYCNTYPGEEKP